MDPPPVSSTFQSMEDFEKEFGLEPSPAHPSPSTTSSNNNANNVTLTDASAPTSSTFQTMEDFEKEFPPQSYRQSKQQGLGGPSLQSGSSLPSPALSAQYSGGTGASTPMSFVQRPQGESVNWVGLLMEYSAQKGNTPPAFSDIPQVGPLEPRFVCSVKIDERAEPFVDTFQSFPRKKLAKQFACQLAMVWLAENGSISPLRVPKLPELLGDSSEQAGEEYKSAASRVPEVCKELGITPPAYRFTNTPEQPMVWSGYAVFLLNEDMRGEVGKFEGVLGRKNAKEVCAGNVLRYLEEYRKRRAKML